MRALVTGATGFVGRALTKRLISDGWSVTGLVRDPLRLAEGVQGIRGDLAKPETLVVDQPYDAVFHLAAALPTASDETYEACNVEATRAMLAASAHVPRFIYMSSISVIGSPDETPVREDHTVAPNNPYSASKLAAERLCIAAHADGRSVVSLRLTSPYGPGMATGTILPLFVARALRGEPLAWHGAGSRAQDFIHVDDAAAGCVAAATAADPAALYNLANGQATAMHDLAKHISSATGAEARSSGQPDPQDGVRWDISIERAAADLGYRSGVAFADGLASYISSARQ